MWIPRTHLPLLISNYEKIICLFWHSTGKKNFLLSPLVKVFNCLTALESNVGVMTVPTVLKVLFEKAAPLPFRRSGTPALSPLGYSYQGTNTLRSVHYVRVKFVNAKKSPVLSTED